MARPETFYWPTANTQAISLTQAVAPLGSFILNGALVSNNIAQFINVSRTVSIRSTDNLSGNTFTITGTLNGATVTATMNPGPNNQTLYTTQTFDTVTSVTTDLAATNASVGSGLLGYTHWSEYNFHATIAGFVVQVEVTGNIKYDFETTLNDVALSSYVPTVGTNLFTPIVAMTNATTSQYANYNNVTRYSRIEVIDTGTTDATGALQVTFVQQGIT